MQGHLIPWWLITAVSHLPSFVTKMPSPACRLEDTPCFPFAGCPRRASCTGNSPRKATFGASESSCGRSLPTGSSLGFSWGTMRWETRLMRNVWAPARSAYGSQSWANVTAAGIPKVVQQAETFSVQWMHPLQMAFLNQHRPFLRFILLPAALFVSFCLLRW